MKQAEVRTLENLWIGVSAAKPRIEEGSTTIPGGGVGTLSRSGRGSPVAGDRDIVLFLALKDSNGNIVTDDVYTAGDYKDVYDYTQLNKTLYSAGTKFKVLAYSKLAEKVYRAGTPISVPHYKVYETPVYTDGGTLNVNNFALNNSNYYEANGEETLYVGNGSSGYLVGTSVTAKLRASKVGTPLYYIHATQGSTYTKMVKYTTDVYTSGGDETYYNKSNVYVTGRGDSKVVNKRKTSPSAVYVYVNQSSYNLRGALANGTDGVRLYLRDATQDKSYTAIGSEFTNVYERDEDGDYEVTPVNPNSKYTGLYQKDDNPTRMYALGKKCEFIPAEVKTQEVTTLTT